MPQMKPMNWMYLFFNLVVMMMIFMVMNFFFLKKINIFTAKCKDKYNKNMILKW